MGTVTGTTQDKLHLVKTYDPTRPYIVGQNGVTAVYTDDSGVEHVEYVINGIKYHTLLTKNINEAVKTIGVKAWNVNNPINSTKSYIPNSKFDDRGTRVDVVYPTTFEYTVTTSADTTNYFVFNDETKMGVVFQPKVEEEVFIERQSISVFESQSRLGEISTLDDLEEYNNGYYNIIKTE